MDRPVVRVGIPVAGEFLMIEAGDSELPSSQINVVLNWAQEIKQRLAAH